MTNVIGADNLKSLSVLSEELHITKPSLLTRMGKIKNFRAKYCSREHNKLVVSDEGAKLISYEKHNSTSNSFHTKRGPNKNELSSARKTEIISQLLDLNKALKAKNKSLDIRMKRLGSTNSYKSELDKMKGMNLIQRIKFMLTGKL